MAALSYRWAQRLARLGNLPRDTANNRGVRGQVRAPQNSFNCYPKLLPEKWHFRYFLILVIKGLILLGF